MRSFYRKLEDMCNQIYRMQKMVKPKHVRSLDSLEPHLHLELLDQAEILPLVRPDDIEEYDCLLKDGPEL